MQYLLNLSYLSIFILSFSLSLTSCSDDNEIQDTTEDITISQEEINGLQYMREEEKLARDVYQYFYIKYDIQMFDNISKSEQSHMDQLEVLLEKYDIEDSSLPEVGKFSNQTLQDLYSALIDKGSVSESEAYLVGATIEDVDIFDLEVFEQEVSQEDIIDVYQKLTCGSRNHMRAFNNQIENNNLDYAAQFISQEAYDTIVNSDNEKCGQH